MANETQTPQEVIEAAESEIPTQKEAQEINPEAKTYGAEDINAKLEKALEKNTQKFDKKEGFSDEDIKNYSEGNLIDGLMQGRKISKEDSRSALASLDASGIQSLKDMAASSEERNKDRDKDEKSNSSKLEKLAQQATELASLRETEGQKKFIQEITQSLKSGEGLNRNTINKLDATFSLLRNHDNSTKKSIIDEIKPALLDAVKDSTMPTDKEIVNRIIKENQG